MKRALLVSLSAALTASTLVSASGTPFQRAAKSGAIVSVERGVKLPEPDKEMCTLGDLLLRYRRQGFGHSLLWHVRQSATLVASDGVAVVTAITDDELTLCQFLTQYGLQIFVSTCPPYAFPVFLNAFSR